MLVAGHGQHVRLSPLLQPLPQVGRVAVDAVARHPGQRQAGVQGPGEHAPGLLRLGREGCVGRQPHRLQARRVLRPVLGQVEFPVHQRVTPRPGVGGGADTDGNMGHSRTTKAAVPSGYPIVYNCNTNPALPQPRPSGGQNQG